MPQNKQITTDKLLPNGLRIIGEGVYKNLYGEDFKDDEPSVFVTCNSCEWVGREDELSLQIPEDEKDDEGVTEAPCCQNCGCIGYLANVRILGEFSDGRFVPSKYLLQQETAVQDQVEGWLE